MFSSAHLLFVGETSEVDSIFSSIQQQMLLRPTGEASPGNTISLLGRKIKHNGNSFAISLGKSYSEEIIKEPALGKCNPAPTPRTSSMKFTIRDEELSDAEQHSTNASWQTTMAVLPQTKHELLHQRTRKITTATINEGHKETLVFYQVPCWYIIYRFRIRPISNNKTTIRSSGLSISSFIIQFLGTTLSATPLSCCACNYSTLTYSTLSYSTCPFY